LAGLGVRPDATEDAALVLTEIASNAVRHAHPLAGGVLQAGWEVDRGAIEIWVRDGGSPSAPAARHPSAESLGGRGLAIVEALAADWGTRCTVGGQEVWARLALGSSRLSRRGR
jgi:anti-sigma regulatory factor (Ser/Thr protein kinase)